MNREFSVGDHFYLRVRAKKSSLKLGICSKISSRYCGSFEVLERIRPVAYRLAFPASTRAHNVFHFSFLKKYIHDRSHVINWDVIQVELEGYIVSNRANVHPQQESHNTLEPSHREGKGEMGVLRS